MAADLILGSYMGVNGEIHKIRAVYQQLEDTRIEFVPVVRCKDCKNKRKSEDAFGCGDMAELCECFFMPEPHRMHEYCSFGEQKDGENNET